MTHLIRIDIDDHGHTVKSPEIEQERRVAVFDLLETNSFKLPDRDGKPMPEGPYGLNLAVRDRRMVFDVSREDGTAVAAFHLALGPFRQVVKDYFQICESYFDAIKHLAPSRIEAIDMARRGIHNEGARVVQERLEGKAIVDSDTARRLFTLICALIEVD